MIYPKDFEAKIGFAEIRRMLRQNCMSPLGEEKADDMQMMDDATEMREKFARISEMRLLLKERDDFPLSHFPDMRQSVSRLRIANTHLEEDELAGLRSSLDAIDRIKRILVPDDFALGDEPKYPHLQILAQEVASFPRIVSGIDRILDEHGKLRDTASPELARIRRELRAAEGSAAGLLRAILRKAKLEGLADKDAEAAMRDGRLVIPVPTALKRRLPGIVRGESSTGKTSYVEPLQVVEANNRIHELESAEKREAARILTEFADTLRPDAMSIAASFSLLAHADFLNAKLRLAGQLGATEPQIEDGPMMDWTGARHPLLALSLAKSGGSVTPLDLRLDPQERILIISGPNAGGKSVCLKTAGLLQYMLQCGLPVPMDEGSRCGPFADIMLDIGDGQSLEGGLSTYSSHLRALKRMLDSASDRTLLLIDELGAGTEPRMGGAIAEAVMRRFLSRGAWAVVTTHYHNLKRFGLQEGAANGAMLYDSVAMRPLFRLRTGSPGPSFAMDTARRAGLPEEVVRDAEDIAGRDYTRTDGYLQDILRDKSLWESKREAAIRREKELEEAVGRYEAALDDIGRERKAILRQTREQAEEMLRECNRVAENTIREIRETQAEREATRRTRQEMDDFHRRLQGTDAAGGTSGQDGKSPHPPGRKGRRADAGDAKGGAPTQETAGAAPPAAAGGTSAEDAFAVGDRVRMKGLPTAGTIEKLDGNTATVVFGGMKMRVGVASLEPATHPEPNPHGGRPPCEASETRAAHPGGVTRETVDSRRREFTGQLDVRGMRGDEALDAAAHFIDSAILAGATEVRILHGKGDGILRQLIRQWLDTEPAVAGYHDEHIQSGGTGITVVEL